MEDIRSLLLRFGAGPTVLAGHQLRTHNIRARGLRISTAGRAVPN